VLRFTSIISIIKFFVLVSLVSGCAGSSPQSTLDAYANAVEEGNAKEAYALLGEDYHERVPFETFAERFEKQRMANGDRIADTLRSAADEASYVDARLPFSEFDALEMSLGDDGWQIESGLFNFYGQRTPRESLHSFIKAVERRKYDVLLEFVPAAYAATMTPETIREQFEADPATIDEMIALLRQSKDGLIQSQGSRAWMEYGGKYRIDFVKENGAWKIEDPD